MDVPKLKPDLPNFDLDDKDVAMAGIVILACWSLTVLENASQIVLMAITALGTLATGRKGRGNGQPKE